MARNTKAEVGNHGSLVSAVQYRGPKDSPGRDKYGGQTDLSDAGLAMLPVGVDGLIPLLSWN